MLDIFGGKHEQKQGATATSSSSSPLLVCVWWWWGGGLGGARQPAVGATYVDIAQVIHSFQIIKHFSVFILIQVYTCCIPLH
jgi:hypothetical protein